MISRYFFNKPAVAFIAAFTIFTAFCFPAFPQDFSPAWQDLGPGQIRKNAVNTWTNVEGMDSYNNPSTGAITKILTDPSNGNTIYASAVNGGIWKTIDGGRNWTPLTDRQSSLSIAAMDFDISDPARQTLIAGTGKTSAYGFSSGPLTGIQYSTDGGNTWAEKGRTELYGKDIAGVASRGDIMMAAVRDIDHPINEVGLWRSIDGGQTFRNTVTGLPAGNIQNLAADPTNSSRFYVSVVNGNDNETGIYRSDDKGATWRLVKPVSGLTAANSEGRILLSVGAQGVLAAQIQQGSTHLEILRSPDQGRTWTDMGKPATPDFTGLFPGGQASMHGAVLVDPKNPNIVYAGGDRQNANEVWPNSIGAKQWSGPVFRGDYNPDTGATVWTYITNDNTKSGSAPHADARTFAIDANGRLLLGDDGGIYAHPSPTTVKTADWVPIMNNLRTTEITQSSWNPITHTVSAAAQDNGPFFQFSGQRGTYDWASINSGDGGPCPVNAVTFKDADISVVYSSSQFLGGFSRFEAGKNDDAQKAATTLTNLKPYILSNGNQIPISGNDAYMSFLSIVTLNREDPRKMAIGGYELLIGTDDPTVKDTKNGYSFPVTSILKPSYEVTSIVYGAGDRAGALLAGTGYFWDTTLPGNLYYSPDAGNVPMKTLNAYPGRYVWRAIFDERDSSRFYVADGSDVWRSTDTGASFTKINGNLPTSFVDRRGLAFAANNGVNALFAGGVSDIANGSGVYVSRFTGNPAADAVTPTWSAFGGSLANAPVYGLSYDTTDDVLLVNLFGRGAWVVYDLTTYFPEATNLAFGKAENDSAPDAAILTDGTPVDGGAGFSRSLIKTGSGTLTMPDAPASYTGGTQFNGGVIAAYRDASFGPSGGWSFDGGALKYLASFDSNRAITLNAGGGIFNSNGFASTLSGVISGPGSLTKTDQGAITLTGNNSYAGGTRFNGGVIAASQDASFGTSGWSFAGGALKYLASFDSSRAVTLNAGGGTFSSNGFDSTLSGVISGPGALTKTDWGTITLTGNNSYAGGTRFNGGVIAAYRDASFGTSGWSFDGGTLQYLASFDSSRAITLNAGGGLFNSNGFASALAGVISGPGALTKIGSGTMVLAADNTYSGGTTINEGALMVNNPGKVTGSGTGTGDVTVDSNGTLGGTGRVGGNVYNNGKQYLASATGNLTIGGTFVQASGGRLEVEIAPGGTRALEVGGNASLGGALRTILPGGYRPALGSQVTIVHAASLTGQFTSLDTVANAAGTLFFKPKYAPSQVDIAFERDYANNLQNRGFTANQQAVGIMLNSVANTPAGQAGDLNTVLNAIDSLTTNGQVAAALDQIAPRGDVATAVMNQNGARIQVANLSGRLQDLRAGMQGVSLRGLNFAIEQDEGLTRSGRPVVLAFNSDTLPEGFRLGGNEKLGIFATGSATTGRVTDPSPQADGSFRNVGLTAGTDYRFTRNLIAGLTAGYNRTRSDLDTSGSTAAISAYTVGVYGTYYRNSVFVDGVVNYGLNNTDKNRRIVYPGVDRTATSDQQGRTWTFSGGAGYDYHVQNWILTPKIMVDYIRLAMDDYTESGAAALNLQVNGESSKMLLGQIGGSVAYQWKTDKSTFMPRFWAMYGREFDAADQIATTAQLAMGSAAFTVFTLPPDRDFVNLGAGITAILPQGTFLYLNASGQVGQSNYYAYNLSAGIRILF